MLTFNQQILDKLCDMAVTLRSAGDEIDGYATFGKKNRKEVGEAIRELRTGIMVCRHAIFERTPY